MGTVETCGDPTVLLVLFRTVLWESVMDFMKSSSFFFVSEKSMWIGSSGL